MLIDKLKAARMQAMRDKNGLARSILTTLLGELEGIAKRDQVSINDDMVIRTCKKFIVGNLETIKLGGDSEKLEAENEILKQFVPKQLSADELRVIIADMKLLNLGQIMQQLKVDHEGTYDGKMASQIAREYIELS
jgi:uncharacterized protein YqeY